jgi:hypothetical protein
MSPEQYRFTGLCGHAHSSPCPILSTAWKELFLPGAEKFSHLISPVRPEAFFARYWGREYLFIARQSPAWYADVLTVGDLDLFLESEQIGAAFINVVSHGVALPMTEWSRTSTAARGDAVVAVPEKLFDFYRNGATIILNQAHHSIPKLSRACRILAQELGFPARANVYITPVNAQGFDRHSDDHEILILVIAGSKKFSLFPTDSETIDVDLQAGDLLYIPKGLQHEARTLDGYSVHLSLGLEPVYEFQLIEELAEIARQDPRFQAPAGSEGRWAATPGESGKDFWLKLQGFLSEDRSQALLSTRLRKLAMSQGRALPDRLSDLQRIHEITLDTIVAARSGLSVRLEENGKSLHVILGSKLLVVRSFLRGAVERLFEESPLAIRDIPGMIPEQGKIAFVRPFIAEGFVSILRV